MAKHSLNWYGSRINRHLAPFVWPLKKCWQSNSVWAFGQLNSKGEWNETKYTLLIVFDVNWRKKKSEKYFRRLLSACRCGYRCRWRHICQNDNILSFITNGFYQHIWCERQIKNMYCAMRYAEYEPSAIEPWMNQYVYVFTMKYTTKKCSLHFMVNK